MTITEGQQDWLTTVPMPTLDHLADQETRDLVIGRRCVTISTYNDFKIYLWGGGVVRVADIPGTLTEPGSSEYCVWCCDFSRLLLLAPSRQITEAHIVTDPDMSNSLMLGFSTPSFNIVGRPIAQELWVSACTNPEDEDDERLAWGVLYERENKLVLGTDRRVQTISLSDASEELLELMV